MVQKAELVEKLNLPAYPFKIRAAGDRKQIFDPIRKKYLVLTPEEWVRQHFVQYLFNDLGYPLSLQKIEAGLTVNSLKKRCDILAYNSYGAPTLLVECKAPSVKITQEVFDQIARYNIVFKVAILVVTNGLVHYCCVMDYNKMTYKFVEAIPHYTEFDKPI